MSKRYTVAQGGKCAYKMRDVATAREAMKIARRWSRSAPACPIWIRKNGASHADGTRTYRTISKCKSGSCDNLGPSASSYRETFAGVRRKGRR